MQTLESLKLIKIKECGWESSKTFYYHTRDLIGVTKMENSNFQKILFFFLLKEIGSGALNGLSKKIPIFKISMGGHIRMTLMALSKKIEVFLIL